MSNPINASILDYARRLLDQKGRCSSDPRAHELAAALMDALEKLAQAKRALQDRDAYAERLDKDAARYRFLRDEEYTESLLNLLRAAGIHKNEVDAAVDAAIAYQDAKSNGNLETNCATGTKATAPPETLGSPHQEALTEERALGWLDVVDAINAMFTENAREAREAGRTCPIVSVDPRNTIDEFYHLIQQIERCGASEDLTKAVVMAGDMRERLKKTLGKFKGVLLGFTERITSTAPATVIMARVMEGPRGTCEERPVRRGIPTIGEELGPPVGTTIHLGRIEE